MKLSKRLFLSTMLVSLFSATATATNDENNTDDNTIFNIDGYHLNAERAVLGHWLGEPIMKSVESYGINKVDTAIVFAQKTDLMKLTQRVTDSTFDTNHDVQAIHIYGEGFNNGVVDKVTGYSILVKDDSSAEGFRMDTYKVKNDGSYKLFKPLSGSVVGAMDCNSAATAAVVFGRANKDLVAMTVGKTYYDEKPVSESKFSSYLLNTSIGFAMQRSQGSPVFENTEVGTSSVGGGTVEPQMLPQEYCGNSSSCDRGDDSCNVLDGGTCNN